MVYTTTAWRAGGLMMDFIIIMAILLAVWVGWEVLYR